MVSVVHYIPFWIAIPPELTVKKTPFLNPLFSYNEKYGILLHFFRKKTSNIVSELNDKKVLNSCWCENVTYSDIYTTLLYSFFVTAMLAMQVDSAIPGLLVDRLCANIRKRCWTSTFCTWWKIILECMLLKKVICPIDKSIFFQGDYLTFKGRICLNLSV